jgi:lipopolysaccharide transport system ATP-binding protein
MLPAISVDRVSKRYELGQLKHETMLREAFLRLVTHPFRRGQNQRQEFWALKDVSFTGARGEVIGLVGRNGAGKSTLLKILSKIAYPTSGRMRLNGRVASLLEVGTGFHEELTGRENIYLNGSILGMKKKEIDSKLDEIVEFSGVEKFIDTPLKRYSSGMALRLGFSVAAHLETEILLVDEVLAVGDIEFQRKCLKKMENLHETGRTVVFVSHNVPAVESLCSRVIWIDKGQIRGDGKTGEIIEDYTATFSNVTGPTSELGEVKERDGDGKIRITALEILDVNRKRKVFVRSGDSVVFRLHYTVTEPVPFPYFGVAFFSDLGVKISEINTWGSGLEIPEMAAGEGFLEVEVPFLNFMPGRYSITLWASQIKVKHDLLSYCAVLEVEPSDYYGSGRGIDRGFGIVFLPCTWNVASQPLAVKMLNYDAVKSEQP